MGLRPPDDLHRAVLHTPCAVVGGYESDDLHLSLSFPQMGDENGDIFQRAGTFVASFKGDGTQMIGSLQTKSGFHWLGRTLADLLSLRFGKRVEFLGFFYSNGHFMQPRSPVQRQPSIVRARHPFISDSPRVDFPPNVRKDPDPFNLAAAKFITWVLESKGLPESATLDAIMSAMHFYAEALRTFEEHPDYAYLSLVTAGEVFTAAFDFDDYKILDNEARAFIDRVREKMGEKDGAFAIKRLFAATNRFVEALSGCLDDDFFLRTESARPELPMGRIQRGTVREALRASYKIRSNLSHAGKRPIPWIRPDQMIEMPIGTPVLDDKEWAKALSKCLTHLGLERIVRYALLKTLLTLEPGKSGSAAESAGSAPGSSPGVVGTGSER